MVGQACKYKRGGFKQREVLHVVGVFWCVGEFQQIYPRDPFAEKDSKQRHVLDSGQRWIRVFLFVCVFVCVCVCVCVCVYVLPGTRVGVG